VTDRPEVQLRSGDCVQVMSEPPANSVVAIVTDPPYGPEFMGKDWDAGSLRRDSAPAAIRSARSVADALEIRHRAARFRRPKKDKAIKR
jgi:DNA modification methylase